MLKFRNRLIKMNNTRLTKRIFLCCHDNPGNTYCEDIMKISNTLNLSPIYHANGIFNIDNIKQSCKELMKIEIEIEHEIQSKPKLRTYKLMKLKLVYIETWMWMKELVMYVNLIYSTNHVYLHRPNAFGFWQMRLHLCYETLNAFRTFLNWLKNSKRVWHEPKLHISRLPLFANFDLWSVSVWWV